MLETFKAAGRVEVIPWGENIGLAGVIFELTSLNSYLWTHIFELVSLNNSHVKKFIVPANEGERVAEVDVPDYWLAQFLFDHLEIAVFYNF